MNYKNYPDVQDTRDKRVNVVGESFYQDNLRTAARWPLAADQYLWVALRAEPDNPKDPRAIRVDWIVPDGSGWLTVGHIPRDETAKWHGIIASAPRKVVWVFPAQLMGGEGVKSYGIYFYGP